LSSLNSDEQNHGRGYIARLSGATAEYLQMWTIMAFGHQPFYYEDGSLIFRPTPVLKQTMFTTEEQTIELQISATAQQTLLLEKNTFTVRFLGHTVITYHNDHRKNTFGDDSATIDRYRLQYIDGSSQVVNKPMLVGKLAEAIRNGNIKKVDIYLQ
jgi:hypothetical protein